jgi:hypothetical protein
MALRSPNVTMVALPLLVIVPMSIRQRPVAWAPQCVTLVGPTSANPPSMWEPPNRSAGDWPIASRGVSPQPVCRPSARFTRSYGSSIPVPCASIPTASMRASGPRAPLVSCSVSTGAHRQDRDQIGPAVPSALLLDTIPALAERASVQSPEPKGEARVNNASRLSVVMRRNAYLAGSPFRRLTRVSTAEAF